ncbi:MAG: nuclear transport factor 2 family protein [Pseudomonadota bacterium]
MSVDDPEVDWAREVLAPLSAKLYDFLPNEAKGLIEQVFAPDALLRLCHPLTVGNDGEAEGGAGYWERALGPLAFAMPNVERRPFIAMAGRTDRGDVWVGHGGTYVGTFSNAFLDIPPTDHLAHMRFHEFFRVVEGCVVEVQMIWDLPELMRQSGVWPLSPSLGREWCVPGPATQDGLQRGPHDPAAAKKSSRRIVAMLEAMIRHPSQGGPEVMEMDSFWHPHMTWYGPSGIGTGRGIAGFRQWHQIPFLSAMPDRGQYPERIQHHFFGEQNYVAVTGWPNMAQTITDDGWLGIAPAGQEVTLRSLDFWRLQGDMIRENWVLVDLLDLYHQIGVDVLARMKQLAGGRS